VVSNLLSNAVKYSPAGGSVDVVVDRFDDAGKRWATVRVVDRGIGIAEKDRARIFEWFGRGKNAIRAGVQGIGIGLAGARRIVEQHGGSMEVESEENQGSTFTVRLPLDLRPPPPS
jgi:signal transduction histidine kinase